MQRPPCRVDVNFLGLPEEMAGAITAVDMPMVVAIHRAKHNRIIQILSVFNCRFLGPNSR